MESTEKDQTEEKQKGLIPWLKRLGWVAVAFFTLKGIAWLVVIYFGVEIFKGCN